MKYFALFMFQVQIQPELNWLLNLPMSITFNIKLMFWTLDLTTIDFIVHCSDVIKISTSNILGPGLKLENCISRRMQIIFSLFCVLIPALIFGGVAVLFSYGIHFLRSNILHTTLIILNTIAGPIAGMFVLGLFFPWANTKVRVCSIFQVFSMFSMRFLTMRYNQTLLKTLFYNSVCFLRRHVRSGRNFYCAAILVSL